MDGPFQFSLTPTGELYLHSESRQGMAVSASHLRASGQTLRARVRLAAVAVLAECERRKWANEDIDTLRRCVG